jgi:hypothetical protein
MLKLLSPKRRGAQSDWTPWAHTDPSTEPKLLRSRNWFAAPDRASLSFKLCTRFKLCAHMNPQTQTVFIPETFVALIRKLRACISFTRCTYADCLQFLADLPLIKSHTELGPLVSTPTLLLSQTWSLMQIAAALLATGAAKKSVTS